MAENNGQSNLIFCCDSQLLYSGYETEFVEGQGLVFDESYRLAHLPLVAPHHPRVIRSKSGTNYKTGIHELVFSIAIPVYADQLYASEEYRNLCNDLKMSNFSHKLSWDTYSQRKNKLHATICSAISTVNHPVIKDDVFTRLREVGPVSIKIRGLFSGNMNVGRLYLKVYPEERDGENMCHVLQRIFKFPITDLYVVGLFNFIDELNINEAKELQSLLNVWRDVEFLQMELKELWMLKSRDDLVLDGSIQQAIPIL